MQNMHNTQRLSVFWEVVHHPYAWCTNHAFQNYNMEFQSIITRIGRTKKRKIAILVTMMEMTTTIIMVAVSSLPMLTVFVTVISAILIITIM